MHKETEALTTDYGRKDAYGALSMPVYHCVAFEFDDFDVMSDAFCGRTTDPDYSRVGNPTVTFLERKVSMLTGAKKTTAFSSGMAAISGILFATAAAGKNIVSSRHLFGNTYSLLTKTLARFGVEARLVDLTDAKAVDEAVDENTCCIFLETVTNPQMEVADLKVLADIIHKVNAPLIADTTMIPFTEFSAKAMGVDFEVVSSTKYLSGGATSLGGLVIEYSDFPAISESLGREVLFNFGAYMTPHPAYMQSLGLETMAVRYARQAESAATIAKALQQNPKVKKVSHATLRQNRHDEACLRQYGPTGGAMITISLESPEACKKFLNSLQMVHRATNLFDNKTLAIHPASTIFGPFSPEERAAMDIDESLIRLSIGLEDPADILADLNQALEKA